MNHNPDLVPPEVPHPDEAIQPNAPDFVETPEVTTTLADREAVPLWLYVVCGFFLYLAGSSFTGFSTFGTSQLDAGPGGQVAAGGDREPPVVTDPVLLGKKIYGNNCANCHHADGAGQPGVYPPMGGSEFVVGSKERLSALMLHGLSGPLTGLPGGSYGTAVMPAWAGVFTDDKLSQLMTYMRADFGNKANAVTPEEVTAARGKFGAQSVPYCEADLMKIAPNGPDPSDKK